MMNVGDVATDIHGGRRTSENPPSHGCRVHPFFALRIKDGGRDRDRTCDPYHVKVVLFR